MNSNKEKKPIKLAFKNLLLDNDTKLFYEPLINKTKRYINDKKKPKFSNNTSLKNISIISQFKKKLPLKTISKLNINKKENLEINKRISPYLYKNKNKNLELIKNKSYKYSLKNISEKIKMPKTKTNYSKIKIQKNRTKNIYTSKNKKDNDTSIIKIRENLKNFNTLEEKEAIKNKILIKKRKIFGMMLKKDKDNKNDNHFINNNNRAHNNFYLYENSIINNLNIYSQNNSYKIDNNSNSLLLIKNKVGTNNNKLLFQKKLIDNDNKGNSIDKNSNFKDDNFNKNKNINMNTISYNSNNSTNQLTNQLTNINQLNHITLIKTKKTLKLNLMPNVGNKNKELNYVKRISQINNNTICLTIDNSVNNTYDNGNNAESKITYIKIKDNSNNKIYGNKKLKEKLSSLFPQKNDSTNHHSHQNIIIKYQKQFKSKEKKKKKENNKFIIMKDKIKKIHEIGKKKQLLFSLNKIRLNKVKLLGIKEIFSNFQKISTKSPKFNTPKMNSALNNFSKINFSGRLNRTEDKNIEFYTSMIEKYKNENTRIKEDPQYVFEYLYDIINNLLIYENNYYEKLDLSQFNLIKNRYYINPDSRKFFINSLINIQDLLNFNERTLFLTIQIFDRYINNVLMKKNIKIKEENLDIVIVTSLIIAAKNEEIKLYSMNDYLNLLPLKYKVNDLQKTEYSILSEFDFDLNIPSMLDFYELFSIEVKLNKIQKAKGLYLLNFILLDSNLVQIPSSLIVYAVIYLISGKNIQFNKLKGEYIWNGKKKIIKIISILKDKQMINNLCGYIKYLYKADKNSNYNAPFNKFNTPNYYFISSYLDI
jgi:hypothetical protein